MERLTSKDIQDGRVILKLGGGSSSKDRSKQGRMGQRGVVE